MTTTRVTTGANTRYTFTFSAPTATIDEIADNAAHHLFDAGYGNHGTVDVPVLYTALTLVDKLKILDTFVSQTITDHAKTQKSNTDQQAAALAAQQYSSANYNLGA